jgi:hypothetical protein
MHGKRNADWPVKPLFQVTRILDVTKKAIDRHLHFQFFACNPTHGVGEQLAKTNRPPRDVPQAPALSRLAAGKNHSISRHDDHLHR